MHSSLPSTKKGVSNIEDGNHIMHRTAEKNFQLLQKQVGIYFSP